MKLEISVIIPVFNMATYVGQSIESVLKQNFQDFELIVVNDGSTDDSLGIINSYAKKDSRIHVISKPNAGLASAYNTGQQVAQGKYIYFLDSDDWMEPDCLSVLYDVAEREKADVVRAEGMISETKGRRIKTHLIPPSKCNRLITNMLTIPEFVSRHVVQWASLYRRSFLISNDIWCSEVPSKMAPDIDFMYHVWAKCERLYVVPRCLIHYRLDNENSDKNSGAKMSFYLLRGHLVARGTMSNLKLPKSYWYVKTKVEFQHFLYELETGRCNNERLLFLKGISKIFRENLKQGLVNFNVFSSSNVKVYKLIAYTPFLYWLNYFLGFWVTILDKSNGIKTHLRFFGIYKQVENMQEEKVYLCGFLIRKRKRKYGNS